MVPTILADANIQGQVNHIVMLIRAGPWCEFWDGLSLQLATFEDIGLSFDAPDSEVWQRCQERGIVLLTDNRNADGPDSLEAVIAAKSTATSLPVVTIGNVKELNVSREYADAVIEGLLDVIMRLDELRGTGRLFLP